MRNLKKIIVVVLFAVAIFGIYRLTIGQPKGQQPTTTPVTRGSISATVSESGNVLSTGASNVTSPISGIIENIFVKNGEQVAAGQNLFSVKSVASAADKASAYASYLNAVSSANSTAENKLTLQGQLETDRQNVLNAQDAVDTMNYNLDNSLVNPATKKTYTQNEIDSINSALTSALENFSAVEKKYLDADTAISAASASVNSNWLAYQNTQNTTVTAPVAGTVANISFASGDQVTGSSATVSSNAISNASGTTASSTSASNVLYLMKGGNPIIQAAVNEVDIPQLTVGQPAEVTFNAIPNTTFTGRIERLDTLGTNNQGVVTYNMYVVLDSADVRIRPGMSVNVNIITNHKDNVLLVPSAAVQTSGGQSYVRVLGKNGQISQVPVQTGISDDTNTEIVSGLSAGQQVVTGFTSSSGAAGGTSPFSRGFGGAGGLRPGGFGGR